MANFITGQELKAYPLPVSAKQWSMIGDDQLEIVIGYASDHLEDFMDRAVDVTEYTERHSRGTGTERLLLGVYPMTTLTSVKSYDGLANETIWTTDKFRYDDAAILEFLQRDYYHFTYASTWEVVYSAGFATVPGPIKHAAALQTVKMLQPIFRGGASYTETELIDNLDEQIVELLDYYKRRRIG